MSVISGSLAYGVSGFLMSLIVIFISRSRQMKVVVFAAVTVAVFFVVLESIVFLYSQSQFFKVYLLSETILDVIFLLGFSILGAWLLTKRNRLKMQEGEKYVQ
jgi:hypothetical protein